jgi:hypothetical protein
MRFAQRTTERIEPGQNHSFHLYKHKLASRRNRRKYLGYREAGTGNLGTCKLGRDRSAGAAVIRIDLDINALAVTKA